MNDKNNEGWEILGEIRSPDRGRKPVIRLRYDEKTNRLFVTKLWPARKKESPCLIIKNTP